MSRLVADIKYAQIDYSVTGLHFTNCDVEDISLCAIHNLLEYREEIKYKEKKEDFS